MISHYVGTPLCIAEDPIKRPQESKYKGVEKKKIC